MLLAYVDESGNTGRVNNGGSLTYSLGCVIVDDGDWPTGFDRFLTFRRRLRDTFGIPMRAEIKANYLLRNSGDLRRLALGPGARRVIYRAHLRLIREIPARAFAVVVDKRAADNSPDGYFELAWEGMLQRLERTSSKEGATFAVIHDEGENDAVRRQVRKARRHLRSGRAFGPGYNVFAARLLVDDPIPRRSEQSYMVQLADLTAYAAFRAHVPPGPAVERVCPTTLWEEIGPATHVAVNSVIRRSRPGIVIR